MRKFNPREKEIIRSLARIELDNINFFSYFLQENYFTASSNQALFVLTKQKMVFLYLKDDVFNNMVARKEELGKLFELLSLLSYLRENRYITIYPNSEATDSELHIMRQDFNNPNKVTDIKVLLNNDGVYFETSNADKICDSKGNTLFQAIKLDEHVYNLVMENVMGLLYVSEDLKDLVSNNFQTTDDIRFKKQQYATWFSIGLATILGLWSIIYPFYADNTSIEVNSNEIKNELKEINFKLDSLSRLTDSTDNKNGYNNK